MGWSVFYAMAFLIMSVPLRLGLYKFVFVMTHMVIFTPMVIAEADFADL